MKITDVACHILQCKVDKPFVSARGWVYGTRSTCVVEISTDEGITGWGECYGPAAVAKTFIETQYKARVVGRDPFDVEAIWEDLYNRIKDYGTTGHGDLGHLRHRHRAVGHHGPRRRQAGAQADRRRLSQRGHPLRHRPLLHRHGPPGRGGGRGGAGVQERRLPRHQDEDRPGRPQARRQARRRGAPGDRPGRQARGRRQPLLLGAQRHQARPHAGGARHPVVRGADQPRGP